MKKYCVVVIGLMLTGALFAQTRQQGQMLEYDLSAKKKPLKAVEIQVLNAQSTVSDKNGAFLLEFRTLKPGDRVQVRSIEKDGYEIFNKEAVEQWNVSSGDGVFEIVMCRSDKFRALKDSYNRASSASYDRQYKQEVARVEKQLREGQLRADEYEAELLRISERYDRQLQTLDTYVDKFARLDLTRLSDSEQQIVALVRQGNFDEAIALYEQQNLIGQITTEIQDLREIQDAQQKLAAKADEKETAIRSLYDAILRQANVLMLAGGQDNMNKVEQLYEQLTLLLPDDTRARMTYIAYLLEQRRFERAALVVEATDTAALDPWHREELYKYAGELYYQSGDYLRSLDYDYRAIAALDRVTDPSLQMEKEGERILIANQIASNEIQQMHLQEGLRWLAEIDSALLRLEQMDAPSLVWMQIAGFHGKGVSYFHLGMMPEALDHFLRMDSLLEAHKNDRTVYNTLTPYFTDLRLIHVCQNIGLIYAAPGDTYNPEKAELYFNAVLNNASRLSEVYPRNVMSYIQDAHQNLGFIYYYTQDAERSLHHTREALRISRELYADHSVTRQSYALVLSNNGYLAADLGDYDFARQILDEAADVIAPLDLSLSDNLEVAYFVFANTAYLYLRQGRYEEGLPVIERAVELGREHNNRSAYGWYSVAMTLSWRAEFARQLGDEAAALRFQSEADALLSAHGQ